MKWKVEIPGAAWSCPVVVGDKVIVTTAVSPNQPKPRAFNPGAGGRFGGGEGKGGPPAEGKGGGEGKGGPPGEGKGGEGKGKGGPPGGGGRPGGFGRGGPPNAIYQWRVMCLDRATGKVLWNELALEGRPHIGTHSSNTFASETPVTDGERVFAYFAMEGLFCYDLSGKLVWKKDLGHYNMMANWGTASSPVVDAGRLFIQCDNEEKSFVVALDAKTGNELWRADRPEKSGWSTPYIWKTKDRTDLVTIGSQRVRGYDPATGKLVWELNVGGGQCSASPVADDERLYVGTGMGGGGRPGGGGDANAPRPGGTLFAVKAGATGDISLKEGETSNAGVAWSAARVWPAAASPLAYQGHVYLLERNGGMVSCFDAKTGKPAYARERISTAKAFWASPWAHDGKIFCLDEDGQTHVLKAGPKFEVLGKNELSKELYWSTPAAADGALFIRGVDHLYCVQ
ncbi:MAG: PQQ-like beta-propeller repeat protein [Gemmataceae bacterium]|nr:PQQ-like beta-propeller repeat protein [Gemmataceae bacterium]